MAREKVRVLFVCLGNICRSPVAEGVFRKLVEEAGLEGTFDIASAGTGDYHVGEPPDARMTQAARRRGVELSQQRAQVLIPAHLERFDHVLVMDRHNLANAQRLATSREQAARVALFRDFDPAPEDRQVPDPYYGGADGFEEVLDIVERTGRALLARLRALHGL